MLCLLCYFLTAIALVVLGLFKYARWHWGSLERNGIKVVPPDHFLLGSALLTYQKPGGLLDIELMKKYGTVFGLYEGREPQVFICDAELIRAITTKDADYFDSKRILDFSDPIMNEMVDFQEKEKWKFGRNMMSVAINSNVRLKHAVPVMVETITDFIAAVKKEMNASGGKLDKFPVDERLYAMITELIARSHFGITLGSESDNQFVRTVRKIMEPPGNEAPAIASYTYAFPFIKRFLPNLMINPEPIQQFLVVLEQLMDNRRRQEWSKDTKKDFLDSCIEWYDNLDSAEYKRVGITKYTVANMALVQFLGGQDQISLLVTAMILEVSKNPEIEMKIRAEVDSVFKANGGRFGRDSELPYLTACVTEATRLFPFFFRGERVCTKDWRDEQRGIKIDKGCVVQIAIWAANRNPEYFEEPEAFRPERFLPGNKEKLHPNAYTSFGFGPRNCIGKKMAMEIMVLMSAYLMKEFKFIKKENTELTFVPAGPFFGAHLPVYFEVASRGEGCEE